MKILQSLHLQLVQYLIMSLVQDLTSVRLSRRYPWQAFTAKKLGGNAKNLQPLVKVTEILLQCIISSVPQDSQVLRLEVLDKARQGQALKNLLPLTPNPNRRKPGKVRFIR